MLTIWLRTCFLSPWIINDVGFLFFFRCSLCSVRSISKFIFFLKHVHAFRLLYLNVHVCLFVCFFTVLWSVCVWQSRAGRRKKDYNITVYHFPAHYQQQVLMGVWNEGSCPWSSQQWTQDKLCIHTFFILVSLFLFSSSNLYPPSTTYRTGPKARDISDFHSPFMPFL